MEAREISSIVKKKLEEKRYTHPHKKDIFKLTRHHDRHFNRGVVFENEELRLRTIEMNAELEREVSHVKKLRKENEKLKHDIWWLRDEYDRLEEGVRALGLDADELKIEENTDKLYDENNEHFESLENEHPSSANFNSKTDSNWKEVRYNEASYESSPQHSFPSIRESDNFRFSNSHHNQEFQLYATIEKKVCNNSKSVYKDANEEDSKSKEENISFRKPSTNFNSLIARSCFSCTSFISSLNLLSLDDPMFAGMSTYDIVRYFEDCEVGINTEYIQNTKKENCYKAREKEFIINNANSACVSSVKLQNEKCDDHSKENPLTYIAEPKNSCRIHVEKQHGIISNNATSFASKQTSIIYLNKAIDISEPEPVAKKISPEDFANKIVVEAKPFHFDVMDLSNPHTVVFSIENHPTLHHITIEEIIDELETQFSKKKLFYSVQAVRILFPYIYVTFVSETGVLCFMNEGFGLKGVNVTLIDASFDTVLLKISGVPNFVSDGTLKILLCAFCIPVSEVRRIYYKGVDTGQRIFRMKLKSGITCPSFLIIGGSKICIEMLHPKNSEMNQRALNNGKADSNRNDVNCYSYGTVHNDGLSRNKLSAYLENKATNLQSLLAWNINDGEKKNNSQVNSTIPYPPNFSRWSVPKTNIVKCPFSLSSEILFSPNNERIRANTTPSTRRNLESLEEHSACQLRQNISADVLPKDFISRAVCIRRNSNRIQKISGKKNKDSAGIRRIDTINESPKQAGPLPKKKSATSLLTKRSEKSDAASNKKGKNRIADDIPWCGCWGNGCF